MRSVDRRVSIHAPAWGATGATVTVDAAASFNPRPRVGGDSGRRVRPATGEVSIHAPAWGATVRERRTSTSLSFNPRPRVGGDRQRCRATIAVDGFNPRPRVGGDRSLADHRSVIVSIHAPAWGATPWHVRGRWPSRRFQSTPPRGGRLDESRGRSPERREGFNPRPRVGGDRLAVEPVAVAAGFNPRPRVGATTATDVTSC